MKRKQFPEALIELDPPPRSQLQINFAVKRNLRSRLPRRCRSKFSPIRCSSSITQSAMPSTDALFASRISSVRRREVKARSCESEMKDVQLELSEASCVETTSGAFSGHSELKLKFKLKKLQNANEIEDSEALVRSDVSSVERFSQSAKGWKSECQNESVTGREKEIEESEISSHMKFPGKISKFKAEIAQRSEDAFEFIEHDVVSLNSALESAAESKFAESRVSGDEVSKPESTDIATDFDLECSKQFIHGDEVFDDSSSAYSELQTYFLLDSSQLDFSKCSPSDWYDISSQISEQYCSDESPSPTFQLFRQFSEEFHRSTYALEDSSYLEDRSHFVEITLGLEENDEESYWMLRSRERRQMYLRDYTKEYCSNTCYGELVVQQRLKMVHWIVQQAEKNELQKETMFLGVNLFDRFLTKGYFREEKKLEIAGIACLTLATRIEENQPLNCIRNKTFEVGIKVYSRSEVVAMEWVVQEVLNFQCFLPTIYNFLWFYLKAARASERVEKTVKYIALVTLLGHEQLSYWPSTVAAALVILTLSSMGQHVSCNLITESHSRTNDHDLPKCMKILKCLPEYIKIQHG